MNNSDFSKEHIIAEFNSMTPQGKRTSYRLDQDEDLKIKGCLSMVPFFLRRTKPSNNEAVLGACFVDSYDTDNKFLCIRNPRVQEFNIFWHLLWDNGVRIVVMTCQLAKDSYQYWSPKENFTLSCSNFKVKTHQIQIHSHYTLTVLGVTKSDRRSKNFRMVYHFQYTAWPRDKFAHQPEAFVQFYRDVDNLYSVLRKRAPGRKPPSMLVHSLDEPAGSEVYCVLDICVTLFKMTGVLSLSSALGKLRQKKVGAINRVELYPLCYQLAKTYVNSSSSSEL